MWEWERDGCLLRWRLLWLIPKALATSIKRLRSLEQAIARSRKVHGKSNQSNLQGPTLYARRRKLHARIVNVRNDHHHQATTAIAKSAGCVVVETLNVAGYGQATADLARAISDAEHVGLPQVKLEYKCTVVRSGIPEGGPVVCVFQALRPVWLEE